jgi:glycosyltransferase involved in cell wall biosynthesis
MNIAFVTPYDSSDVKRWSGIGLYMGQCIEDSGANVFRVGSLRPKRTIGNASAHLWATMVARQRDHAHRHPSVLASYARQVAQRLQDLSVRGVTIDAILSPGVLPIAMLETRTPIIVWTDCTFASMVGYYESWTNLSARSLRFGNTADRLGLSRASHLVFASEWAARSAIEDYGCDPSKISIVPLGANVRGRISAIEARTLVPQRLASPHRFLLIGVDWMRKGCDFAISVVDCLRQRGFDCMLDIVGCQPPAGRVLPGYVVCHGFVSKSSASGLSKIEGLLKQSTALLLPTRAECQGVVFNEAAAFGLPVFAPATGGIDSVVRNEVTGCLFPTSASPLQWAGKIAELLSDESAYESWSIAATQEFEQRLSWRAAGSRVIDLIRQCVERGSPARVSERS